MLVFQECRGCTGVFGFPSLNVTARLSHMTPRTLHRSLIDEGTAFKEILEDVRYRLAVEYLKSGHLTIQEIAYTLGYTASPTSAGRSSAGRVFHLPRTERARAGLFEPATPSVAAGGGLGA